MFDLPQLIQSVSYLGLFFIVFAETGLLTGFFLPGDSLLITAGLLAAEGSLDLFQVISTCVIASIFGNLMGYFIGQKLGQRLFNKPKSRFFNLEHIVKTRAYFDTYGSKTIIVARFIPIIRTFVATVSGMSAMNFGKFTLYSVVGGALWAISLPLLAFYLGRMIPGLDKYILVVIAVVIFVSLIPVALEYRKHPKSTEN